MRVDRIWEFLQRFSPLTRSCLLTELERLELCGVDMPGSADIQARLRAELRPGRRGGRPSHPLQILLRAAGAAACRRRARARQSRPHGAEFAGPDLGVDLPRPAAGHGPRLQRPDESADQRKQAEGRGAGGRDLPVQGRKVAGGKSGIAEGAERARVRLKAYTASPSVYGDLVKMMGALRARDALAKFGAELPKEIAKLTTRRSARSPSSSMHSGKRLPTPYPSRWRWSPDG